MKSKAYEREQRRIRAAAAAAIGSIKGDDPTRSQNVSKLVREILIKKYEDRPKRTVVVPQRSDKTRT